MKRIFKSLTAVLLVICIMLSATVAVFAAGREVYLSDLRLIYAYDYKEAKQIMSSSKLDNYTVLNQNLNSGSGEIGVWLAYKVTTNINEAITDVAVMQMGGGYSAGNYRELIKSISDEYDEMGEIYLQAVDYFMYAYDSGSFLAESAYRQLNFYNGFDNYPDDRLGDLFVDAVVTSSELATLFVQGNPYVLKNIRSLLAMGVSYNDDGMHYLEKVGESAAKMNAKPDVFDGEDYEDLASLIAPHLATFRTMFLELSAYEDELDYSDEEITDLELKYSEYKAMADRMREVEYLGGQTLYEFCLNYAMNTWDYSSIYPLVDALNEGQRALTTVSDFYDVVRYSMTDVPEELIDGEISKLEEEHGDSPIDIYTGVDRSIYEETFALTGNAYRADAYYDSNSLMDALFGDTWIMKDSYLSTSTVDVGLSVWSIKDIADSVTDAEKAESTTKVIARYTGMVRQVINAIGGQKVSEGPFVNSIIKKYTFYDLVYDLIYNYDKNLADPDWTFEKLMDCFKHEVIAGGMTRSEEAKALLNLLGIKLDAAKSAVVKKAPTVSSTMLGISAKFTTLFYFFDTALLATAAISLGIKVYDHYNPVYDDVPTAMVDVVHTDGGDVYIKYNAVCEVNTKKDGSYHPADLNAYEGQRWNVLYYTKNDKAGKPLLADFVISSVNNRASDGYLPVHRFGEVVCYDLNKYNFSSSSDNIFLSVAQSENHKAIGVELPDVVGSVFGSGFVFLACGAGLVVGVVGTFCVQSVIKKKKASE